MDHYINNINDDDDDGDGINNNNNTKGTSTTASTRINLQMSHGGGPPLWLSPMFVPWFAGAVGAEGRAMCVCLCVCGRWHATSG